MSTLLASFAAVTALPQRLSQRLEAVFWAGWSLAPQAATSSALSTSSQSSPRCASKSSQTLGHPVAILPTPLSMRRPGPTSSLNLPSSLRLRCHCHPVSRNLPFFLQHLRSWLLWIAVESIRLESAPSTVIRNITIRCDCVSVFINLECKRCVWCLIWSTSA